MEIIDKLNIIFWTFAPMIVLVISQCLIEQGTELKKDFWKDDPLFDSVLLTLDP